MSLRVSPIRSCEPHGAPSASPMPVEPTYLDIVVDVPAVGDRTFTYCCPREIRLPRGAKVRVTFGRSKVDGFVLGECAAKPPFSVKPIEDVYDVSFMPTPDLLSLALALGRYYCAPTAASWSYLYPPVVPRKSVVRILKEGGLPARSSEPEPEGAKVPGDAGLVSPVDTPEAELREGSVTEPGIWKKMESVPVLYIWGSPGFRWRQYLRLAEETLGKGQSVLFLFPEVKVLESSLARLTARFPGEVSSLNSEMTGLVRRAAWLSLLKGESRIGAGTRSAAFAPVRDLGLVILDEEASPAHKFLEWPFFDARTVALARGTEGAQVVFGSSYPSVEAVHSIEKSRWSCMREESSQGPEEFVQMDRPRFRIIDLKEIRTGNDTISDPLQEELATAFAAGLRAVLFLNRRGDSSHVSCRDCGSVLSCGRCGVPMTYHSKEAQMVCHTCGFREDAPAVCPDCGGHKWRFSGFGVEKVEAEFRRKFAGIPVLRLDQDATRKSSPDEVLTAFGQASPSCLICTQMVLGQSLMPPVGVVGVLSADTSLSVPDFRASERAYRLLSSLKDLVDRGMGSRGCFLVQTRNPDHHALKGVLDGAHFYENELQMRRMLGYPPFRRFFRVKFESKSLERAKEAASEFASNLSPEGDVRVLGPAPAPKPKMRGIYRWHVALKGDDHGEMVSGCLRALKAASKFRNVRVLVDVDPVETE